MKKFSDKVKQVADNAKDLIEKILRWRAMELDRLLHIKYEPGKHNSKSHFEAIMGDVNEDPKKVEEMLKLHELSGKLLEEKLFLEGFSDIDLSDEQKAEIEHKKKLKKMREAQMHLEMTKNKR
jgi:hypothetical protein